MTASPASLTELLESSGGSRLELSAEGLDMEVNAGEGSYTIVNHGVVVLYDATSYTQSPHEYAEAQLAALSQINAQARQLLAHLYKGESAAKAFLTALKSPPRHWRNASIVMAKLTVNLAIAVSARTLNPKSCLEKRVQEYDRNASAYASAAPVFAYGHEFFTGLERAAETHDGIKAKLAECANIAHNLSASYSAMADNRRRVADSIKTVIGILYANNG